MNRPADNVALVKSLLKERYGHDLAHMKQLNGYDDRNYYIKTVDNKEFILKITNHEETMMPGYLDAVNALILHLYNNGLRVTVPQLNASGQYLSYERIGSPGQPTTDEQVYGFRLLEYIPGKLLLHVPFTPALLAECGQYLARIDTALETFSAPALDKRQANWSLMNVLSVRRYLDAVENESDRRMVAVSLDQFQTEVLTVLDRLEYGYIHGDYNEQNIIVQSGADGQHHVEGVIDFGDANYNPKVFDLAIFLAYTMLGEFTAGPQLLIPGCGLKGYLQTRRLTEVETSVLMVCIKARLCQSLVMGAHSYRLDSTNTYVLSSAKNGWPALRALHECNAEQTLQKWLNIDNHLTE